MIDSRARRWRVESRWRWGDDGSFSYRASLCQRSRGSKNGTGRKRKMRVKSRSGYRLFRVSDYTPATACRLDAMLYGAIVLAATQACVNSQSAAVGSV